MNESAVRVSVCMAAHRGEAYIEEQIDSILAQLGPSDELIVVDDASPDLTPNLVAAVSDSRVVLVRNGTVQGYVRTFERALQIARGSYLFLADQDDVWLPGRLNAMLHALTSSAVVSSSVSVLGDDADLPRYRLRARDSTRHLRNIFAVMIGYRPYTGCAMAMRRDILSSVIPFPEFVFESHDLWLALVANTHRQNVHLEAPSVARRLHSANQTPLGWRSLRKIVRSRWMKARCLLVAIKRARSYRARTLGP